MPKRQRGPKPAPGAVPPTKRKRGAAATSSSSTPPSTAPAASTASTSSNARRDHLLIAEAILLPRYQAQADAGAAVAATLTSRVDDGVARTTHFEDWTVCLTPPVDGGRVVWLRGRRSALSAAELRDGGDTGRDGSGGSGSGSAAAFEWEIISLERARFKKASVVRRATVTVCPCSGNGRTFFEALGHTFDREFVRSGLLLETRSGVDIRIMQHHPDAPRRGDRDLAVNTPWLFELSCVANSDEERDTRGAALLRYLSKIRDLAQPVISMPEQRVYRMA